ncbi:MAG: hypothetical protein S4CHLAM45_07270 [Chlamydiales bacterium]|nr:hypothetical protein [Chlamydiales bacterium]MCH9620256.1 hypothetical protein [Chlamydiales bacterium]MCH9622834.1 hypothetical protein [Chlamydiales bacterium]
MSELTRLIEKNRVPHALLIVDGEKRAKQFAQQLVETDKEFHPDLHEIRPEGNFHPIASLRQLAEDVALSPYQAPYKVFLIYQAEQMQPASANALLKTFEEPSDRTVIILLSSHPDTILPTILSRCQTYRYQESEEEQSAIDPLLDYLAGEGKVPEYEKIEQKYFDAMMRWYRDLYITHLGLPPTLLFYPHREEQYKKLTPRPLDEIEKELLLIRLGTERSIKFENALAPFSGE